MESKRLSKVARLIQKELGDYFQKQGQTKYLGSLVSVTTVRVSPDLSVAHIYVSIFPPQHRDEVFKSITVVNRDIRHELAQRTRHQLRKIPTLDFHLDDSLDYAEKIDDLLK